MPLIKRWDPATKRRVGSTPAAKAPIKVGDRYKRAVLRYCKTGCGALLAPYRHYCDDCTEKKKREAQQKWRKTKRPSQAKPADQHKPHHSSTKTHCPDGHAYDEENTYLSPQGFRKCRKCQRKRQREWRERNRAKR